jgi:archaemetzincin
MHDNAIQLISLGTFDKNLMLNTAKALEKIFGRIVYYQQAYQDLSAFYDASRRQYNGNQLLQFINDTYAKEGTKTIGLVNVDLFIPILTFIYGQAFLNGKSGIASMHRLGNERYGMQPDQRILEERFIKEVVHELGHCYGLIHCHQPDCVMRSSTYVEDIDQKNPHFCLNCKTHL